MKLMLIALEAPPISMTYPSGGDLATNSDAMLVIAPGRCSTITCCLMTGISRSVIARVMMSVLPPGAKGLTIRMGLVGYVWAAAPGANARTQAISAAVLQRMNPVPAPARTVDDRFEVFGEHVTVGDQLPCRLAHFLQIRRLRRIAFGDRGTR